MSVSRQTTGGSAISPSSSDAVDCGGLLIVVGRQEVFTGLVGRHVHRVALRAVWNRWAKDRHSCGRYLKLVIPKSPALRRPAKRYFWSGSMAMGAGRPLSSASPRCFNLPVLGVIPRRWQSDLLLGRTHTCSKPMPCLRRSVVAGNDINTQTGPKGELTQGRISKMARKRAMMSEGSRDVPVQRINCYTESGND